MPISKFTLLAPPLGATRPAPSLHGMRSVSVGRQGAAVSVRLGLPMRYGAHSWPRSRSRSRSRSRISIWLLLAACGLVLAQLAAAGRGRMPPDTAVKAAAAAAADDCEAECEVEPRCCWGEVQNMDYYFDL